MNKVQEIFYNSYHEMRASSIVRNQTNETVDKQLYISEQAESFPITRSSRNSNREDVDSSNISTPAADSIISGQRHIDNHSKSSVSPQISNGRIKWTNTPRQPIPHSDRRHQPVDRSSTQPPADARQVHGHTPARSAHHTRRWIPRRTAGSTQSARVTKDNRPKVTSQCVSLAVS